MLPFFSYVWIIIFRSDGQSVGHVKYFAACKWQKKNGRRLARPASEERNCIIKDVE